MRRIFVALSLFLSLALPAAANADPIKYTLVDTFGSRYPPVVIADLSGTFTFTIPSELSGKVAVVSPDYVFLGPEYLLPGYTYIVASEFTRPDTSGLDSLFFDFMPNGLVNISLSSPPDVAFGTGLAPNPDVPGGFIHVFFGETDMTLTPQDLGTSPVPEPSTLALIGTGVVALTIRIRRKT